ncbi:hypothetical protein PybrP1_000853 [[Pythium] brassicae (nom. inval.)]|nr:hypothetical protein PybrP1_000853 [[Pythium] brassicae (nom. inval.)]
MSSSDGGGVDAAGRVPDAHQEVLELTAASNPYLDFYRAFCASHERELIDIFDPTIKEKTRAKIYAALDVSVAMKYSWAIPDERALRIIKHYGPIVEMGAGNGYWGKLLQLRGVDIICYDLHVADDDEGEELARQGDEEQGRSSADSGDGDAQQQSPDQQDETEGRGDEADDKSEESADQHDESGDEVAVANDTHSDSGASDDDFVEEDEDEEVEVEQIYWTNVLKGTPKDLRRHSDRTLFLCYPDDFEDSDESMALQSLYNYTGDTVIHVGELFGQTLCLPSAWGRTSAKEFQEHLASVYHKVLQVPLPSWHSSIDTLTVWKRSKTSMMGSAIYAFIPADERLDLMEASPSTRHLLEDPESLDASERKRRKRE